MSTSSRVLPEFFLDKNDHAALASGVLTSFASHGALTAALVLCVLFAALALVFVVLRAKLLEAGSGPIAAGIGLVLLCMSTRVGIAFDAFAWCFAALLLYVMQRGDRYRWYLPAIVLAWSVTLDSGTIGAALVALRALGTAIDERRVNARVQSATLVAVVCILASLLSAAGLSFVFAGARAFYFDMMLPGADRQPLWSSPVTLNAIGVFAIMAISAIGGIARHKAAADVLIFVALLVSAVLDIRMAPFFAIAVVPPLLARYAAVFPASVRLGVPFAVACAVLAALPLPAGSTTSPAAFASLARDGAHRVVCTTPRWCNPVEDLRASGLSALTVGNPEAASAKDRDLQRRIEQDSAEIVDHLRTAHADALLASDRMAAPAILMLQPGWRVAARDDNAHRVLLVRVTPQ